jgi:hypothetical protein
MTEELEILAWMLIAAFAIAAVPFALSGMRARRPGKLRRPLRIREIDPNDVYTC